MPRSVLLACAILWCQAAHAQTAERIAALAFVRANGFVIPAMVIVARETTSDSTRPASPPKTTAGLRERAAIEIARSISRGAVTGPVHELLECRNRICVSRSDTPTLLIGDPATSGGETVVRVELYSSALSRGVVMRTLTAAVVVVEPRGSGWIGVRYSTRPTRTEPRLPPPEE